MILLCYSYDDLLVSSRVPPNVRSLVDVAFCGRHNRKFNFFFFIDYTRPDVFATTLKIVSVLLKLFSISATTTVPSAYAPDAICSLRTNRSL